MKCHVAALLIAMSVVAQDPPRDAKALTEALASTEAETVAWAAHDARALGDKTLIVPLQRTLSAWREDQSTDGRAVLMCVLDALIELQVKVPAAELLPLLDDASCGTAAFVLLAQHPKQNEPELLELFGKPIPATDWESEQQSLRTCAIGNLLCAQRTPGFARLVWQQLDLSLGVDVGVVPSCGGWQGQVTCRERAGATAMHERFPPTAIYRLADPFDRIDEFQHDAPHAKRLRLLAEGPLPVSFGRMATSPPECEQLGSPFDPTAWLLRLALTELNEPSRVVRARDVDARTYLAAVNEARAKLHAYHEALRRALVRSGALTEAEATELSTAVEVIVVDWRKDQSKPLPEIPSR